MLELLNEQERELIARAARKELLWAPLPGPQLEALLSPADELFFGGAAGGGKSDLLLGLAVTSQQKSIIFRRQYAQFRGAGGLIERSREIIGDAASYNGLASMWRGIPSNRMLEFGAVQYEQDKNNYKGRAHDLKAFDELPEFTESQYRFLIGWARTTDPNQKVRVVATGNPPTTDDGQWVIQYWGPWLDPDHPNPARAGELRWFAMIDGKDVEQSNGDAFDHKDQTIKPKSRTFIPAHVQDNPYLMATDYITVLQGLPEPLRSQLLDGDFHAAREADPWQCIPTEWVQLAQARWRETEGPDVPLSALGVDPARGGGDEFAIAKRYGNWFSFKTWPGSSVKDGPAGATLIVEENDSCMDCNGTGDNLETELQCEACEGSGDASIPVNVDIIGIGSSVYDSAKANGVDVKPINFAAGSSRRDRTGKFKMRNIRAAAYWGMREALDPVKGDSLALPPGRRVLADLCTPRYKVTPQGIQIESKEDIVKRIGRSPDVGDALALALYEYAGGFNFG